MFKRLGLACSRKRMLGQLFQKIEYLYNASGVKVKKKVTDGSNIKAVDYLDASTMLSTSSFQYAGSVLQFFPHPEGYVKATVATPTNTSYYYDYVYNYTDHLGNVRLSYSKDPATGELKILEENHYYPFGLSHEVYGNGSKMDYKKSADPHNGTVITYATQIPYQYKFNSREYQDELGLNLYGMDVRGYDPATGRFNVIDPMAAYAPSHTPYRFGFNNPVYWADPSGLYEINSTDTQTNIILNESEMEAYQAMVDSGSLDGLSGQDLVDAIVAGLDAAGFTNDYTLGEATITGSAKSRSSGAEYAFSNQCIIGCHQTPGMQRGNTGNPFFKRTESETFYWFTGGRGPGLGGNSFMRPGDKVEFSDLLEWLSISRMSTPSSMETQALADVFQIAQMLGEGGSSLTTEQKDTTLFISKPGKYFSELKDTAVTNTPSNVNDVNKLDSMRQSQQWQNYRDSLKSQGWYPLGPEN